MDTGKSKRISKAMRSRQDRAVATWKAGAAPDTAPLHAAIHRVLKMAGTGGRDSGLIDDIHDRARDLMQSHALGYIVSQVKLHHTLHHHAPQKIDRKHMPTDLYDLRVLAETTYKIVVKRDANGWLAAEQLERLRRVARQLEALDIRPEPSGDRGIDYSEIAQADFVSAVNQVLGDGTIQSHHVTRAAPPIPSNRKSNCKMLDLGKALDWIVNRQRLDDDERAQVRNAMIGQIIERNKQRN